ncbi:hypothetical protein PHYSODRAFT_338368 [Phytophthora sojae]|uniref:Uncharacterized protein n=1 Tax=Phytophthora sojae (strain P6497) TaxID=1094619 RepID=G5A4J8_PHYSP|nr:hypothetical protein PHYSODRAFT_338368 [Phytophthora sojae]EGZ09599.1 hypothetical protein PHYSODRAFT_338368 [Phytophthora sojae]|eukprot:XP_009534460.1 hypothetical protein PHYSODRAFT_338368 [Phytophthora sojae]
MRRHEREDDQETHGRKRDGLKAQGENTNSKPQEREWAARRPSARKDGGGIKCAQDGEGTKGFKFAEDSKETKATKCAKDCGGNKAPGGGADDVLPPTLDITQDKKNKKKVPKMEKMRRLEQQTARGVESQGIHLLLQQT